MVPFACKCQSPQAHFQIVDIVAALCSMGCLIGFLKVWQSRELWLAPALPPLMHRARQIEYRQILDQL